MAEHRKMLQKVKKNLQKQEQAQAQAQAGAQAGAGAGAGVKNNAGCVWNLFHNLQQNRWHKVVKTLPRARLGSAKHSTVQDKAAQDKAKPSSSNAAPEVVQDNADNIVDKCTAEAKHINTSSPAHKNKVKSRFKALITDEMHKKKKDRHQRTTSHPTKTPSDENVPVPVPVTVPDPVPVPSDDNNVQHVDNDNNNVRPVVNYLKQSEVDMLGEHPVRDHTFLHGNLIYAIEPTEDDSLNQSKLYMNALTLLNMREEMFLKILKDPNSSLANQMPQRQPNNVRLGLNKSMSFSAPLHSAAPSLAKHSDVIIPKKTDEHREEKEVEIPNTAPPPVTNVVKKKNDERVGLKRFKNIRHKIKHVIKDKKKEKNRIMMDAFHHKVPIGTSPSKKLSEDIEHQGSDFGNNSAQTYKRTSSFDNSLHRYNQLIDVSPNKETKDRVFDESKLKIADAKHGGPRKRAPLGRNLSSPEIRLYTHARIDETRDTVPGIHEKKSLLHEPDLEEKDKVDTCSASEKDNDNEKDKDSDNQETAGEEPADSKANEVGLYHDSQHESETSPCAQPSKPETETSPCAQPSKSETETSPSAQSLKQETDEVTVNDSEANKGYASISNDSKPCEAQVPSADDTSDVPEGSEIHDMDSWLLSQDMIDIDIEGELDLFESHVSEDAVGIVQENQIQQFYSDLMRVEVDDNNRAEFNYVKGVLELSGFSKNEMLGDWQSADNPLDPAMFDEVGGEQECYGNEAVICNQLMLFDLINEVLLHVHDRSFCYWPTPLTNRSTIHPLPKGSRVLEEVWAEIRLLLIAQAETHGDDDDTDDAVSKDLAKNDGWMNLQLDAECVVIELEELIFDDLLLHLFSA